MKYYMQIDLFGEKIHEFNSKEEAIKAGNAFIEKEGKYYHELIFYVWDERGEWTKEGYGKYRYI